MQRCIVPTVGTTTGTTGATPTLSREGSVDVASLPCFCSTHPHECPQGQALVAAIHERLGN